MHKTAPVNRERQLAYVDVVNNGSGNDPQLFEGVLSRLALFRRVARAHVATIASHARLQSAPHGTILCRQGEALPGILVIAYGSAKLSLRRNDGEEKVVRLLGAGETFGEAAAMHNRPCPVDAIVLVDSMVVQIPRLPLQRLFEVDPQFAHNLASMLADKFLNLLGEFQATLQHSALQRLSAYLESLAELNGAPNVWIARLPASKTTVAARLGITKETMSRLLRELANRGLIAVERRDIEIRDLPALSRIVR